MTKILQINTNRSHDALDLALATARNLSVDLILISEPNKKLIEKKGWLSDSRKDSCIVILNSDIKIIERGEGEGFTYIKTQEFSIFSCYSSGNRELSELEDMLDQMSAIIRRGNNKCIVAGDFNSKSPLWGMSKTDARGAKMEEWVAQLDLLPLNEGSKPTFQCENYGSVLDLTLVNQEFKNRISDWMVLEDESLSDHNFILFTIAKSVSHNKKRLEKEGWHTKNLDEAKLANVVTKTSWEGVISAGEFSSILKQICNNTLQKKGKGKKFKPVYWWNSVIAFKRNECVRKRRCYTRAMKKNSSLAITGHLWLEFQITRKDLRNEIKKAKRQSWKKLVEEVENDIWGDGYQITMKCTIGYPQPNRLTMDAMVNVTRHLFPPAVPLIDRDLDDDLDVITEGRDGNKTVINVCDNNGCDSDPVIFLDFSNKELEEASNKLKAKKAPGPGLIPSEVLKMVSKISPGNVLGIYNNLAKEGNFPTQWKIAELILLSKSKELLEDPSSFRPICLLDVEGKLYELLLAARLDEEIERTGGLSEQQYGFRSGRQTIDAIKRVVEIADEADSFSWKYRRICAAITLDVKNAFNCASWEQILKAMEKRGIDRSLYRIISSYLSERKIVLKTQEEEKVLEVQRGVPQGSVLGPKLWNILYDGLFKVKLPDGVTLVGFADDVIMLVTAKTEDAIMEKGNLALQKVAEWMSGQHLELAPHKSEAVLLTKKRKMGPIQFVLGENIIQPIRAVKYLGVWLDTKLTFSEHIDRTVEKTSKTISALSKIMPNINGPKSSKRKILASVVHSKILYAAPVWHKAMENKKLASKLLSLQRTMAIRVSSAYRTISGAAVRVIASIPPIDLMVEERTNRYEGSAKNEARRKLMESWQHRWEQGDTGRWTYRLIPRIEAWIERPYGEVDYYLTQALSGHGNFNKYLWEKRRRDTAECRYCREDDDVEHTLFECPRWRVIREEHKERTALQFDISYVQNKLISKKEEWIEMYKTIRKILETKEKEEELEM